MNCREGDLAVQIKCEFNPRNIGAMYNVLQPCGCHPGKAWYVTPLQDVIENVKLLNRYIAVCRAGDWCCCWDAELRPIRGDGPMVGRTTPKELEHI